VEIEQSDSQPTNCITRYCTTGPCI